MISLILLFFLAFLTVCVLLEVTNLSFGLSWNVSFIFTVCVWVLPYFFLVVGSVLILFYLSLFSAFLYICTLSIFIDKCNIIGCEVLSLPNSFPVVTSNLLTYSVISDMLDLIFPTALFYYLFYCSNSPFFCLIIANWTKFQAVTFWSVAPIISCTGFPFCRWSLSLWRYVYVRIIWKPVTQDCPHKMLCVRTALNTLQPRLHGPFRIFTAAPSFQTPSTHSYVTISPFPNFLTASWVWILTFVINIIKSLF